MVFTLSFEDIIKLSQEYQKQLIAGVAAVGILVGGVLGYFYYIETRETSAHRAMVNALEYFDAKITKPGEKNTDEFDFIDKKEFATEQEKWEKVADVFGKAYSSNSGSGISSLFLAYKADAFAKAGKKDEAITVLHKVVGLLGNAELKSYYQVKLALMQMDSAKKDEVDNGISTLKSISIKDGNIANDTALFRLGQYYWYKKNFKEARNYWNQLLLKFGAKTKYPSPWISVAKEKLELIDSDVA